MDLAVGQEFKAGVALYERGQFGDARRCFETALLAEPDSGEIHFKIATCHWAEGNRYATLRSLEAAVSLDPSLAKAQEWLGQWYLQEGMGEAAMRHSLAAAKLSPNDASVVLSHAFVLEASGDLDGAWQLASSLIGEGYAPPRAAMLFGRLAPRYRKTQEALALVERSLRHASKPGHARSLHFTAAELLDRMGQYERAFAHAREANRIGRKPWDGARCAEEIDRLVNFFTEERFASLARARNKSEHPVLIVGMPRSGTSLVEQITASHPLAHGAGELDFLHHIRVGAIGMVGAQEEDYPECLGRLTGEQVDGLAEVYLEPLKAMAPGALRIVDKMPLNFMHLGLAAMLLPGARVVHCRRDPMDTCLSCFMTHFTSGHEFASDLKDLAILYRQYSRVMQHWEKVLPLRMTELSYEQLVTDPKTEVAKFLEFLGLPWDERCLNFHQKRRFVTTASVEQVRRPVYATSVGRWKNYGSQLRELATELVSSGA
jgi:tetratricopeptide (TPR) repeat protein